jgi:minor extracellular serine protease Vpr
MTSSRAALSMVLALLLWSSVSAGGLNDAERARLHPALQRLLTQGDTPTALAKPAPGDPLELIVYTSDPNALRATGLEVNTIGEGFATVRCDIAGLERIAQLPSVTFVDPGGLNTVQNDVSVPEIGATLLHAGFVDGTAYRGAGAIVAVFDTGIDWVHPDFRSRTDPRRSRILWLWDQTLTATGSESRPTGFTYGVEYSNAQINDELDGTPANVVRERDANGHGSHVAGSAAGNGGALGGKYAGVAPEADLIVIKGGENSFSESRMIDALTYLNTKAQTAGKPVVLNFSVGGQSGPHDGTRAYETAINSFVASPGRAVVVSAGNDGAQAIHGGGTLPANGSVSLTFTVPSYTPASGTSNDEFFFDLWFAGAQGVTATVTSPGGIVFSRAASETGDSPNTANGTITLWNYLSSLNGMRNVQLWVHDQTTTPPASGTWRLDIVNTTSTAVAYDGWLTSRTLGSATVTLAGADNLKTLTMPGTSAGSITVASWVTKWGWPSYTGSNRLYSGADRTGNISTFSSIGPTRDGRQKPDIAAPGQGITSVLSSAVDTTGQSAWIVPGQKHWVMQGTSMAAPHVTGAVALLLGKAPSLGVEQIRSLLTSTANTDALTGSTWNATWGYGKLDILEAVARQSSASAIVTRKTFSYDLSSANTTVRLTGAGKLAVRFTPDVSGRLTGMLVNATTINNRPIIGNGPLLCEVYTDSNGIPGRKLGTTVQHALQLLNAGTQNYVQLLGANVTVTAGTDFHLVLTQSTATDTLIVRGDSESGAVRSRVFNGTSWSNPGANLRIAAIVATGTLPDSPGTVVKAYDLSQNWPNPFNAGTTFTFVMAATGHATVTVYDLLGRVVATLADDELVEGMHRLDWRPSGLASGVYFYRLRAGEASVVKKMILLR